MHEFDARRLQEFPDADPDETAALRYVKSWHRHPAVHAALWYEGINLGEMDEYLLLSPVLRAFLKRSGRIRE